MNSSESAASGDNAVIAERLREAAALLAAQGANPFRIAAYRKAAATIAQWPESVRVVFERGGVAALDALPHIGAGLRSMIAELLITGRSARLERLRGSVDPAAIFAAVPGIGPVLAKRLHDALEIDTLEALEIAAHDGRLEKVSGVGARRAAAIRAALASMLGRVRAQRSPVPIARARPDVGLLLAIDREYREKAAAGTLAKIAPRRFNPAGEAWLPVLHAKRGDWHFTALYSNTASAHQLGRTRDWVVIYFYDHDHVEGQQTIVTETHGALVGKRVVRGREPECRALYSAAMA